MQLLTLGRLGLSGDALTRPKPLMLLAYLALEGRQSREHLVEVFFGGEQGGAARLRTTLRRVRQVMPQALITDRDTLDTTVSCDAVQFQQWLDTGELVRGTAAYTGAFLLGAALPTWTVELEEWLYRTRERLADRQRQALLDLALLDAQRAEFPAAAAYAVRAAELTDTSEPSTEQLRALTLLLTAGGVALPAPLAQLVSRERLTVPSSTHARADLLDGRWRRTEAASLPVYGTSFVGREEERAAVLRTLAMPDVRLVTLVGPGGIGKTRLAREAARMFPQRDEVAFVQVEPHMTAQHLPTALAHVLHAPDPATADALEGVRQLLNRRSVLLVLDSAELLGGDFGWLSGLLRACPSVKVLVTSRERLTLDEAWTLHLRGLTLPPEGAAPQQVRESEAVQLFVTRAMRQQLDLQLGPDDLQVIWRICAAVGGSPLGVELAAAWVRLMPVAQIAQELTRSLDLLTDRSPVQARHHSMRAVFDQSWAQLLPHEQVALARLSVFGAGWTAQGAQAVAQADLSVLSRLVDCSFVEVTPERRYRLHPLMQQFAAERLHLQPDLEERTTALRRAAMLDFVRAAGQALRGYDAEGTWVERVFREFENLRQSLSEWLQRGEVEAAADTLNTLRPFWMRGLALPEIRQWFGQVLAGQAHLSPALRADTLLLAGEADMYAGNLDSAVARMTASLALMHEQTRPVALGHLLIGQAAWRRDDLTLARHHFTQAHQAFAEQENLPGMAASLNNLALILRQSGDLREAHTTFAAALNAKRQAGGDEDTVLINMGSVLRDLGDYAAAREHLTQGLHGVVQRGYRQFVPEALVELGRLALAAGHPVLAVQLLSAATAQGQALGVVRPAHEQAESDRAAQHGEALLGQDAFAAAWQSGQELPLEHIVQQVEKWADTPLLNSGASQNA